MKLKEKLLIGSVFLFIGPLLLHVIKMFYEDGIFSHPLFYTLILPSGIGLISLLACLEFMKREV